MSDRLMPYLRYEDAPAALKYLVNAFGFEIASDHRDDRGRVAHAELRFADTWISLSSPNEGGVPMKTPRQLGGAPIGLYFVVDDPDAHFARAKAAGMEVVRPPETQDYGGRDYTVRDPEGFLWSFGTYRPGKS